MKIKIIAVGKIKEKYLKQGIQDYSTRISAYVKNEIIEVQDEKAPEKLSDSELELIIISEGEKILSKISPTDYVIALAIQGKQKDSETFSKFFSNHMIYDGRDVVFVIGGSNGLSEAVLKRADDLLSFSKFTFPHQLMRLILLEQIYRAYKIMKNEPYHK